MLVFRAIFGFHLCALLAFTTALATPLSDLNSDGQVKLLAFGDSITAGLGDTLQPGQEFDSYPLPLGPGYPSRLSTLSGLPVTNSGRAGETLSTDGVARIPSLLLSSDADLVLIFEGANDAIHLTDTSAVRTALQKIINVTFALGKQPLLMTIPAPCCGHAGSAPFIVSYNSAIYTLSEANSVPLAELARAWESTCQNKEECELFVLPDGLHPNSLGYDVLAQTVAASLFEIDIFAPDGAKALEGALGLTEGTIIVKPEADV